MNSIGINVHLDVGVLGHSHDVVLDLDGQLTSRGQNERFQPPRDLVLRKRKFFGDIEIELYVLDDFDTTGLKSERSS